MSWSVQHGNVASESGGFETKSEMMETDFSWLHHIPNDTIFEHKLRLLDVAARLRQRGTHVCSLRLGA